MAVQHRVQPSLPDCGEIFLWLLGEWAITREVRSQATIAGTAMVTAQELDGAEYAESVEVCLASGDVLHGEQKYWFERRPYGLAVYFHAPESDGARRLFHELHFCTVDDYRVAKARHLCAADAYESTYCISGGESFTVTHSVRGPFKDYVIESHYRRMSRPESGSYE